MATHADSPARSGRLDAVTVGSVMQPGTITAPLDLSLTAVARMLAVYRVHAVVVHDDLAEREGGDPAWGVVTDRAVLAAAARTGLHGLCARDVARHGVTIPLYATLREAIAQMRREDTSHLLVVEATGRSPLGIVSTLDVAAALGGVAPTSSDGS
jgi:CBS domain-containing protein